MRIKLQTLDSNPNQVMNENRLGEGKTLEDLDLTILSYNRT